MYATFIILFSLFLPSLISSKSFSISFQETTPSMAQKKMVVKIMTMNDSKTKQKAMEAVADISGVDSIASDLKEQKITVIGVMDTVVVAKRLKKLGKIDIITVGPAKEEKKDDQKKDEKKDDKKDEKKPVKK